MTLKPIIFKLFRRTTPLARFCLKARAQIANNFPRNSFARGNTSLLTPNFAILSRVDTCDQKLPDDDQLMIETCWGDFKSFNVWHLN
jgi:hypothetical protein